MVDNQVKARITICQILSEILKEPSSELISDLPAMTAALREAFAVLGYNIPLAYYQDWPQLAGDASELQRHYFDSFFYPNELRVVPVESIYRQWTFDESAQVPFAKEKGYLMSDAALHMKSLYDQLGLVVPPEYQSSPDHLCLELEFAALLLEQGQTEWYKTFVHDHLTWVEELRQDAAKNGIYRLYRDVIAVTAEYISCELQTL